MIFVTVGTQLPFDRLVAAVDAWAAASASRPDVLAQVGCGRDDFTHIRCVRSLDSRQYAAAIEEAALMIAHAGTGSILAAAEKGIPIIVVPRDDRLGEHRDDHQIQTARQLERMGLVEVAWDVAALSGLIDRSLGRPTGRRPRRGGSELVDFLRGYLVSVLR